MSPSVGDNVILESGTIKTDKVAMRDLAFWLPLTKPHLVNGVNFANSFETLVNLPIPQIGYIYNHRLRLCMHIFDQVVLL